MNIAKTMDSPDFAQSIAAAVRALSAVSDMSDIRSVPSIAEGNRQSHAIGLGQIIYMATWQGAYLLRLRRSARFHQYLFLCGHLLRIKNFKPISHRKKNCICWF